MLIDADKTALIVVDMWDSHYCKTLTLRANLLASRINTALSHFRQHCIPILFMAEDVLPAHREEVGARILSAYKHLFTADWKEIQHPPAPGYRTWWNQCVCTDGTNCPGNYTWSTLHPGIDRSPYDLIGGWWMHTGFIRAHELTTLLYCGMASNICVLDARHFSVCQSLGGGMECILLGDLVESFIPDYGWAEANQKMEEYYEEYICPVSPWRDIHFSGIGIWEPYSSFPLR